MLIFFKRSIIFTGVALIFVPILAGGQSRNQIYNLNAQNYKIEKIKGDYDAITLDGFYSYAVPGYPDLPAKIYYIAVPPDVDEHSIEVDYSLKEVVNLGNYRIREIPPLVTWKDNQQIAGGKADIYPQDNYFPERIVEYLGLSQMRKWRLVVLRYTPFQYNPATCNLLYIPDVAARITYKRKGETYVSAEELADSVMDERASKIVMNYSESYDWYRSRGNMLQSTTEYDYVIITTSTIKYGYSWYLSGDFVTHLRNKGYSPLIVTEIEFGGLTGQYPNGTADKIRKWLQNHYLSYGIKYVLLIGNPDPDDPELAGDSVGDIPMKYLSGRGSDYSYADLTGNWDLDGDGIFGEYSDDSGTGGVDFVNELYVGRIPFYSAADDLVSVLTKIISYGSTSDILWRRSALLPTSFQDPQTDGAYWAEAMISGYLTGAGFSNWKMYQQGSACAAADSPFVSDEELRDGKTVSRWSSNDYGMVWWQGHGNATGAYIGWEGCEDGAIITSSDVTSLADNHPSFVFQSSCATGQTEASNNLGKSLLYSGAIATVCTNYTSWYATGDWTTANKYYCDDRSIGYYYGEELVANNKTAGEALFDVKSEMGVNGGWWKWDSWKNLCGYNLYGDPSVSILENGLGPALDNNTLQFLTVGDGTAVWYKQSETYYYDGDAAQSGNINHNETVAIYSKVSGPGVLKFYWKVSSEQSFDFLGFYIDGYLKDQISGERDWEQKIYEISEGVHSLSWRYEKDSSNSQGSDCGWVDKVEFLLPSDDLMGTWSSSGVWYRNSETGSWVLMSTPAQMIAAGDLDGDETDDLAGTWSSGLWVKHSSTGSWTKLSANLPTSIASGDMNGDARDDVVASFASGVWYRNSVTGGWVQMSSSPASKIVAGDIDGDNIDDLIAVWASGLWVKKSASKTWTKISSNLPTDIAAGDMSGDGRVDVVGSWSSGVWYRNSATGPWVLMSSVPATLVAAGDIDNDSKDDLIGVWASGFWVKKSATGSWMKISCATLPRDIDAGLFRTGETSDVTGFAEPVLLNSEAPGINGAFEDLSNEGPGGWNFRFEQEENLIPFESESGIVLGPGDPGLQFEVQENLVPQEKTVLEQKGSDNKK